MQAYHQYGVGSRAALQITKRCARLAAASDNVYHLLAHGRWFSPSTPASSTTETGRHNIAELLLKMALNTINQIISLNVVMKTNSKMFFYRSKKGNDMHRPFVHF